jgi:hypothetical protein
MRRLWRRIRFAAILSKKEITMLRMALLVAFLSLGPALLHADVIETQDGTRYEGIVVEFGSDIVRLNTGYGKLTFKRKTHFKMGEVSDYKWPKGVEVEEGPKPKTTILFVDWCKKNAPSAKPKTDDEGNSDQPKSDDKKPAPVNPGERETVSSKEDQKDQISAESLRQRIVDLGKVQNDDSLSPKEKRSKLDKFSYKWAYLCGRIASVRENEGVITIEIETQWHDAISGDPIDLHNRGPAMNVLAFKSKAARESYGEVDYEMSWSIAENLKKGDGIVFTCGFECKNGEPEWTTKVTDLAPVKKPKRVD